MAIEPTPYPWVRFLLTPTKSIDSTPLQIFSSPQHCIVDGIFVSNTSGRDIYVDVNVKATREGQEDSYALIKRQKVPKSGRAQLIPSVLHLQSGDKIYASSDFSGNTFDCEVSYRELTELWEETAVEPFSYPWVNFLMTPLRFVGSTPALIFGSTYDCIIDSIFICNISGKEMFVDAYILTERNLVAQENYFAPREEFEKNQTKDLTGTSSLQMQAGDLLFVKSDFASNTFDCLVSYREIREEAE